MIFGGKPHFALLSGFEEDRIVEETDEEIDIT
jgi:hypothetical protein